MAEGETVTRFALDAAIAVLERTPATLRTLLAGLPDEWISATEGPNTWTPRQVVAHLAHGERTDWIPRARIILAQGANVRFQPFDRTGHLEEADANSLETLLDRFTQLRRESLEALRGWALTERELALRGEHPDFGPVTLRNLLATWVAHDLDHVVQIARTMAKQYTHDAGPWTAYIRVLRD